MQKVTKAIIPAAGLGTRFLPATKAVPKEMLPIVDTPTLQYIIEEAAASGIEDILIIQGLKSVLFILIKHLCPYLCIPPYISDPLPPVKGKHLIIKLNIMVNALKGIVS